MSDDTQTDPEFLRDLANRIEEIPVMYGVDECDVDLLRMIAESLEENEYVLHWLDGRVEVITGNGIKDAFNRAGIGAGALKALDYHSMVTA